jgi:hypothetical protein
MPRCNGIFISLGLIGLVERWERLMNGIGFTALAGTAKASSSADA